MQIWGYPSCIDKDEAYVLTTDFISSTIPFNSDVIREVLGKISGSGGARKRKRVVLPIAPKFKNLDRVAND